MIQIPFFSQLDDSIKNFDKNQTCGISCVKMILDFYLPNQKNDINDLIKEGILIKAYDPDLLGGVWVHDGLVKILRNHGVAAYSQEFRSVKVDLEKKITQENKKVEKNNENVIDAQKEINKKNEIKNKNEISLINFGLNKIKKNLENNQPVIVSVLPNFSKNQDSHLVIIKGFENNQFIFADPYSGDDMFFDQEYFLKFWKKLAIFTSTL